MPQFSIIAADSPERIAEFRLLCRQYEASLPFSLCFQGFEAEMAGLPGKYAPPGGCMYLAIVGDGSEARPGGCIALRPLEPEVCEMKRLYVAPEYRGLGLGRALGSQVIADARRIGYRTMKLDTSADMVQAQALYRSLGFVPTARYNDDPLEDTLYFALDLMSSAVAAGREGDGGG